MLQTTINLANKLWWPIVISLLLATSIFGTLAGIIALAFTVFALPVLLSPTAFETISAQPMLKLFVLGFALMVFVSAINATSLEDMRFVGNFLPFLLAIPAFLLAKKRAGSATTIRLLALCVLGSFFAFAIAMVETQFQGSNRAQGYYSGAIIFARNATALGFIGAMGFVLSKSPTRFLFLLGPVFAIGATLMAEARGIIIAAPILLLMLTIFLAIRAPAKWKKPILIIVVLSMVMAIVALFTSDFTTRISAMSDVLPQLLQSGTTSDTSTNIRLDFYRTGIELFTQSPFLGHGWAQMSEKVYTILNPENYSQLLVQRFHFHNDLLNFGFAGGLLGILSYVVFLLAPLVGAFISENDPLRILRIQLMSLLVMLYFISGLTDMVIGFDLPTALFALLSALVLGAMKQDPTPT